MVNNRGWLLKSSPSCFQFRNLPYKIHGDFIVQLVMQGRHARLGRHGACLDRLKGHAKNSAQGKPVLYDVYKPVTYLHPYPPR